MSILKKYFDANKNGVNDTQEVTLGAVILSVVLIVLMVLGVLMYKGIQEVKYQTQIRDTEIWNGTITRKVEDEREESYSCNCTVDEDGWSSCSTCYETVYDYWFETTAGDITIATGLEESFFGDKPTPPQLWEDASVGDPVAIQKTYKNYDKASDTPLFRVDTKSIYEKYQNYVPEEPKVYDKYKINRFFNYAMVYGGQADYDINWKLSQINGRLGPTKEANVMVFVIPEYIDGSLSDDFWYAVAEKWEGINKNEYVFFVTVDEEGAIKYVQGLSWTTNVKTIELEVDDYAVNTIVKLEEVEDMYLLLDDIESTMNEHFVRTEMESLEFLHRENRKDI